jgi:hypothetical protein
MFGLAAKPQPTHVDTSKLATPFFGGVAGAVLQNILTQKVVGRVSRVGGLPGMVAGVVATYAINRLLTKMAEKRAATPR